MSLTLECEGALSDAVLQVARQAVADFPGNPYAGHPWQQCGPRNQPLMPLLDALVDATAAVVGAIQDNNEELPANGAKGLADELRQMAETLMSVSVAPAGVGWSLPSMTGKELV